MTFTLPKLDYEYDALEPHIDSKTMHIHHTLHHQTYINKANAALADTVYENVNAEKLLKGINSLPSNLQKAVQEHVGGHFNHSLFWQVMSPQATGEPEGSVAQAINEQLGSFDKFKDQFTAAAISQFGSGWAWLCVTPDKKLIVENSANQDCPLMQGNTPILGLDVWEHAYYLKYQNKRPDYIAAFYNVINWQEVQRRYLLAIG
ncbi:MULTISPECIES: superoxide dismutase [Pseudoalteromonas]|jgi:Fe-Mn family superoxide dismutase|uniref:Superoxide dismutase n=2 Tax=Pseudoalteromonas aliena TaxID=247523 RepID=A0A1Q2GTE1_9GAMM|nr:MULTISPECIES: superoxide dismutase [Pseudoalteromonas]AQP98337.1 superoxide dismutase [Pseudoalteromonas aliena]MBE0361529.1 superoxide dismutase, Fe-Mn family [Pseudoalteromonas aliena SW19]TMO10376.1 superoxide dismutase [Pseudoalteromonas sp. S558]